MSTAFLVVEKLAGLWCKIVLQFLHSNDRRRLCELLLPHLVSLTHSNPWTKFDRAAHFSSFRPSFFSVSFYVHLQLFFLLFSHLLSCSLMFFTRLLFLLLASVKDDSHFNHILSVGSCIDFFPFSPILFLKVNAALPVEEVF